ERNEPQPPVLEPVDGDEPGTLGFRVALCTLEVTEHTGAGVLRVALLGLCAVAEKGVAPGGIDHISRPPHLLASVLVLGSDEGATLRSGLNIAYAASFHDGRADVGGTPDQNLVELR